jgi:hypothetical protein
VIGRLVWGSLVVIGAIAAACVVGWGLCKLFGIW